MKINQNVQCLIIFLLSFSITFSCFLIWKHEIIKKEENNMVVTTTTIEETKENKNEEIILEEVY